MLVAPVIPIRRAVSQMGTSLVEFPAPLPSDESSRLEG